MKARRFAHSSLLSGTDLWKGRASTRRVVVVSLVVLVVVVSVVVLVSAARCLVLVVVVSVVVVVSAARCLAQAYEDRESRHVDLITVASVGSDGFVGLRAHRFCLPRL